jgi:hypothetical protein
MAFRFATTSGLALAVAMFAAGATRAQSFFDSYQLSPRQVAGVLSDDGYQLRGPIMRRGDVYVCDAVSVSGRSVRLIVSARDGHVIDRYATDDRRRYADEGNGWGWSRPQRSVDENDDRSAQPRDQFALGDLFSGPSRVYGNDSMFGPKPAPSPSPTSDSIETSKPKHHALKKHHDPAVAKAPASEPTPGAEPSATPSPSVAAVAPDKSSVEPPKPEVIKPAPTPDAVSSPTPQPKQTTVENEKPAAVAAQKPTPPVTQKPEIQRKKINDLPVGTLD